MPALAVGDFPFELILLLVAAIIGGVNKLLETSRSMRKKSVERQKSEARGGVELGAPEGETPGGVELEEPPEKARRRPGRAKGPEALDLPIPDFGVPLPLPETLAPRPEIRNVETARRPRPPKPRLQLGGQPTPPRPIAKPRRRPTPKPPPPPRVRALGLGDPQRLREAIVLREILGPPVALRDRRAR